MVFTGKPSAGCQMCRARKIKCDELRPSCSQCQRTGQQCPGYRSVQNLLFRHRTSAIAAAKAQTRAKHRRSASDGISSVASPCESTAVFKRQASHADISPRPDSVIAPAMQVPPDQLAVCHFFANFVLVPFQGTGRGYLDFLVPMVPSSASASISHARPHGAALNHAFRACALAGMGSRVASDSFDFSGKAFSAYTQALAATHAALRDPAEAREDGTLAAVLLLSLFENITARQTGMFAWGSHTEGAIALAQARGKSQLQTKTGLSLFIAVRTQMIIHSLTSSKPPTMDLEWWLRDAVSEQAAAACQRLSIKTAGLRAEANRCMSTLIQTPENRDRVRSLARQAHDIDREYILWAERLPDSWQPQTIAWKSNLPTHPGDYAAIEVFPGRMDLYGDLYIASVWNMARSSRLCLWSVVVRCAAWGCAPADYRTTAEYAVASRTCGNLIADMIASVPFHLGWHLRNGDQIVKPRQNERNQMDVSGFACGNEAGLKGLAGYFLAWPLANLSSQDYTTDAQRAWVVGRLRYIADSLGVRYAGTLAELEIRMPSMMIRRDKLMAQRRAATSHGIQVPPLSAQAAQADPRPCAMNPLQQWQALQWQSAEDGKEQLLAEAYGESGLGGKWVAQRMLHV